MASKFKTNNEEISPVVVKDIKVCCDNEVFFDGQKKYRTVFRADEVNCIFADVLLSVQYMADSWEDKITFELHRAADGDFKNNRSVWKAEAISDTEHKLTVRFQNRLEIGTYTIRTLFKGCQIGAAEFHVVDIPNDNGKCFSMKHFSFYRDDDEKSSLRSFAFNELTEIGLAFGANNQLPYPWQSEFIISLFDETGMLKEQVARHGKLGYPDDYIYFSVRFGEGKQSYWRMGSYRVEVVFMNELIIVAPFEIGNKDIETTFDPSTIHPKTKQSGRKIVLDSTLNIAALDQINQLIGLRSLKKELKRYVDLVQFNKERKKAGNVIKPISLHALFLGNPGTGKTTVAQLMGKIFHEMGLLSEGNMVFAERSTLTGKFWGEEEEKTLQVIEKAKGGVLFIDEAHNLAMTDDPKDPGLRVIETLFTTLSNESNRDMMIILAGYPEPMTKMLNKNPGMKSRFPNEYHFDDYTSDELMQIADLYLTDNNFTITEEAKAALHRTVKNAYNLRDEKFGNGRYIVSLMENEIIPNMASRLIATSVIEPIEKINLIEKSDVPQLQTEDQEDTLAILGTMVGLSNLKKSILDHLSFVRFAKLRNDMGKFTDIPPLHMIFTGNPGTGKTTVAGYIGKIYRSLGILSRGHVAQVTRSDLVDNIVGGTEKKTKAAIEHARGGVLFIDEAYTLMGEGKDFGRHVIETLLTTLSKEHIDMIVVLAGYANEMDEMLASNPGLKSRFPYTFHFEDYSAEELFQIAEMFVAQKGYTFSANAKEALHALIKKDCQHRDEHFGNARYVTRLITTKIIPNMGKRALELSETQIKEDPTLIETIEAIDIPIETTEIEIINRSGFDENSITELLTRLDAMVGLAKVKEAIHKFVAITRYRHQQGKTAMDNNSMKWGFSGNAGNGKSAVAEIFAGLLKAMNLIGKGHLVELKAEELYYLPEHIADKTLRKKLFAAQQGLLFIDGTTKKTDERFNSAWLRNQLSGYASFLPATYALVYAEHDAPGKNAAKDFPITDIVSFDQQFAFEDYTEHELMMILHHILKRENMSMDEQATHTMTQYISGLSAAKHVDRATARTMNTLAKTIVNNAILRTCKSNETKMNYMIIRDDVASFVWNENVTKRRQVNPIGFRNCA